jgi:hypothetical protein
MSKENCRLLARAKGLAIEKGLDPGQVECPFTEVCIGTTCHLIDPNLGEAWGKIITEQYALSDNKNGN